MNRMRPGWQQRTMTVDALVVQVGGMTPGEFIAAVARAAFEFTGGVNDLYLAAALPDVMARTIQSAKRLNSIIGQRDRMALLADAGLLSAPRPVTVRLRDPGPPTPVVEPDMPAFLKALTLNRKTET